MFRILHRTALGVLAAAALAFPAAAQEAPLSALNFVPNHTSFGKPFADWVADVNKKGKGIVQIQIKPPGAMSPFTMGNAIKNGVADMANLPATFYQNLLPVGDAVKLTRISFADYRKNGAWALLNKLHNEKVNAQLLNIWGYPAQFHLYLRDKTISEANLKGLKLRVTPVYRAFFRALGADLVQTAPAEVFTALERGTIDGYGWPLWDIKSLGWDKHTKYRIEPGFYHPASQVIMNLDKWKKLAARQRNFLNREAIRFEAEFPKQGPALNAHYAKEQETAGVKVITLKGKAAAEYLRQAYEAGWAEVIKLDPVNGPALKKLIYDK